MDEDKKRRASLSKRFFTSDQHFGHANILKYEDETRRKPNGGRFRDVDQMDTYLIEQWNATVGKDDVVYCLGDLSYKIASATEALAKMNGTKILIVGNHDPFFKQMIGNDEQRRNAHERAPSIGYAEIHLELILEIPGIGMAKLSHFPYEPLEDADENYTRYIDLRPVPSGEEILLHGHVHSQWLWKMDKYGILPPMINLGIEMWGMKPVSEDQLVKLYREVMANGNTLGQPKV